jgi:hypothetical protein
MKRVLKEYKGDEPIYMKTPSVFWFHKEIDSWVKPYFE